MKFDIFRQPAADRFLYVAQAPNLSVAERLDTLNGLEASAPDLISVGNGEHSARPDRLHIATWLACMPCIYDIAKNRRVSTATAEQVSQNLQIHIADVLDEASQTFAAPEKDFATKDGFYNEVTVLALMWWGIARRLNKPHTYVLPSSTKEDEGGYDDRGFKTGYDLVLRDYSYMQRYIQVKSSSRHARRYYVERGNRVLKDIRPSYRPDIAVFGPGDLIDAHPNYPTLLLMDTLVKNDAPTLKRANQRVMDFLKKAKDSGDRYFSSMQNQRRRKKRQK